MSQVRNLGLVHDFQDPEKTGPEGDWRRLQSPMAEKKRAIVEFVASLWSRGYPAYCEYNYGVEGSQLFYFLLQKNTLDRRIIPRTAIDSAPPR